MRNNLVGQRFGKLVVVAHAGTKVGNNGKKLALWDCICDCGKHKICVAPNLTTGRTKSCGCLKKRGQRKHGLSSSRLYSIWENMKTRCYNPLSINYHNYGGKGVRVCGQWLSFESFAKWAMENGYSDVLTLDRIDGGGDYCPENCRWATPREQSRNTSRNHYITIEGETKLLCDWAKLSGLHHVTILNRIKRGVSGAELIRPPKARASQ